MSAASTDGRETDVEMRIAVVGGAGAMGRVTVADAARSPGVAEVLVVDRDDEAAAALVRSLEPLPVSAREPGEGSDGLVAALSGADAVVNAATHRINRAV